MNEDTAKKETAKKDEGWFGETVRTVVYAVLIAMVIRSFAFEPFKIPSESMLPTLKIGDYLFVSKYSYGYSKHSFPFSMGPFEGRILSDLPKRGDVAVFKKPVGEPIDYIKRIVGLPGDKLQMKNSVLHINGKPVQRKKVADYVDRDIRGNMRRYAQYEDTLPNGVSFNTLDMVPNGTADNTGVYTVPAGHVFGMGDNRDNSTDSRFLSEVGYIPVENLVGRADLIFYSLDGGTSFLEIWQVPFATRWERVMTLIN